MTTTETLITIHDQSLIESCEAERRFEHVQPYRYLFVGPRPLSLRTLPVPLERVIVSRRWPGNVEGWPEFYDFTGWWSVANKGLSKAGQLICLQYDHRVPAPVPNEPTIHERVDAVLAEHPLGAFVAGHRLAHNFMLLIPGFEDAYRFGLAAVGCAPMEAWPDFNEWSSTQGTAWRTDALSEFMHWVRPAFDVWAGHLWAGHLMERMPKAWLAHTGQTEGYLHGLITHEGQDCHGTCHLMGGDAATHAARAATFGRVIGEPVVESSL